MQKWLINIISTTTSTVITCVSVPLSQQWHALMLQIDFISDWEYYNMQAHEYICCLSGGYSNILNYLIFSLPFPCGTIVYTWQNIESCILLNLYYQMHRKSKRLFEWKFCKRSEHVCTYIVNIWICCTNATK